MYQELLQNARQNAAPATCVIMKEYQQWRQLSGRRPLCKETSLQEKDWFHLFLRRNKLNPLESLLASPASSWKLFWESLLLCACYLVDHSESCNREFDNVSYAWDTCGFVFLSQIACDWTNCDWAMLRLARRGIHTKFQHSSSLRLLNEGSFSLIKNISPNWLTKFIVA